MDAETDAPITFTFRSPYLPGRTFEGRSCEHAAPEGTVALMFRRTASGYEKCGIGQFKNGTWIRGTRGGPIKSDGLYWVVMANG